LERFLAEPGVPASIAEVLVQAYVSRRDEASAEVGDDKSDMTDPRDHRVGAIDPALSDDGPGVRVDIANHFDAMALAQIPQMGEGLGAEGKASSQGPCIQVVVVAHCDYSLR
jgi:hypothetical protein